MPPFISDNRASQSNLTADARLSTFLRTHDEDGEGRLQRRRGSFESSESQDTITEREPVGLAYIERLSPDGRSYNSIEDQPMESVQATSKAGRPSLLDILLRRSVKPFTLFDFYIYMRDVYKSEDYLDFW